MGDLIIKPETGGSIKLQNNAGTNALVSDNSGNITLAGATTLTGNVTLSGTANALGTVATGNLSNNNIVMPRFKEYDQYKKGSGVSSSTINQDAINISGTDYLTVTPEHTGDLIEFGWDMMMYGSTGYTGCGIEKSTATNFSSKDTIWAHGRHAQRWYSEVNFMELGGTLSNTASAFNMSAGTTYYCRMIGMTHSVSGSWNWGDSATNAVLGSGHYLVMKRWSIV